MLTCHCSKAMLLNSFLPQRCPSDTPQLMLPVCSKSTAAASAVLMRAMMVMHKHTAHKASFDAMQCRALSLLTHCYQRCHFVMWCRALIPMHADLRLAGTLPPLDAPHHMRATEWATYREGVVLSSVPGEGSLLNVGLDKVSHVSHKP